MSLQIYRIASYTTTSSSVSTFDFSSIPSGYTDLKLVISTRGSNANIFSGVLISFNTDTGASSYTYRAMQGDGTSAASFVATQGSMFIGNQVGSSATANIFGSLEVYIPNYTSSNNKSVGASCVSENNATTSYTNLIAGIWNSGSATAAINKIVVTNSSGGNFLQNTTATLYGIL